MFKVHPGIENGFLLSDTVAVLPLHVYEEKLALGEGGDVRFGPYEGIDFVITTSSATSGFGGCEPVIPCESPPGHHQGLFYSQFVCCA